MRIRDNFIACLEMGEAEYHQYGINEQLARPGEKAKIVALARKMSRPLLQAILGKITKDTHPIRGGRQQLQTLAYGGEAIVFGVKGDSNERLVKLFHRDGTAADHQARTTILQKYLGSQLEPQFLFECTSPYGSGDTLVGAVQRRVDGTDLFVDPSKALPEEISRFWEATKLMFDETGSIPDLIGHRNVLVDGAGYIHCVDHGITTFKREYEVQRGSEQMNALATFARYAKAA